MATETSGIWKTWREDVCCVFERDPAARSRLEVLLAYPGVHALLLHRVSHRLWRRGWRLSGRLISFAARMFTGIEIHPGAEIGRRFFIDHGTGVVIGETAQVGDDCTIYHGVTLGGTTWSQGKRHPTLGNGVMIGAGAKILGALDIGDNAMVGSNSVVIRDVPAGRTVVGIPAKVVRLKEAGEPNPYGIDLNHHLIPDPVGHAIGCLMRRIHQLERQQVAQLECDDCETDTACPDRAGGKGV